MKLLLRASTLTFTGVVLLSLAFTAGAKAQTPPPDTPCPASGYVLGFFNGVGNDEVGALNGLAALRDLVGPTWKGEPVAPVLFYNYGDPLILLPDIAEVFIQRAQEIDFTGFLAGHFELLWEVYGVSNDRTFLERIVGRVPPGSVRLIDALSREVLARLVAELAKSLSSPPTALDQARHNVRLDELALRGKKLMLVAHSQGNLFVNLAYDHIGPQIGATSVATVHIAPASITLRGTHVLADIDLVINALRLLGTWSVPDINLFIPPSLDKTGHTLVGTYLDGTRSGRNTVRNMISNALDNLTTPPICPPAGGWQQYTISAVTLPGAPTSLGFRNLAFNNKGDIVWNGYLYSGGHAVPFTIQGANLTAVSGVNGGNQINVGGINDKGEVAGTFCDPSLEIPLPPPMTGRVDGCRIFTTTVGAILAAPIDIPTGVRQLQQYRVFLPASRTYWFLPWGMNNNGDIVGFYEAPNIIDAGFVLGGTSSSSGALTTFQQYVYPSGINDFGNSVGRTCPGTGGCIPFLRHADGTFGDIPPQVPADSEYAGINNVGLIVGKDNYTRLGFLVLGNEIFPLTAFGNNISFLGINNAGQLLGYDNSSQSHFIATPVQ